MSGIVREATDKDVEGILNLICEAHTSSAYRWHPIDVNKVHLIINLALKEGLVVVVDDGNKLIGVIIGELTPVWWSGGNGVTSVFFYVQPGAVGSTYHLYKRLVEWSVRKGAFIVSVTCGHSQPGVSTSHHKLLLKLGFFSVGSFYLLPLTPEGISSLCELQNQK